MSTPSANVGGVLHPLGKLIGCAVSAADGEIGTIDDFCFDDTAWIVRYFHVDTGPWLHDRQILISPSAVKNADWNDGRISVAMTKDLIEAGPEIPLGREVSHQEEVGLVEHFAWMPYWGPAKGAPVTGIGGVSRESNTPVSLPVCERKKTPDIGPKLRRFSELVTLGVRTETGKGGKVIDAIVDTRSWLIGKLVIKRRKWLLARAVAVALPWIDRVDWDGKHVHVGLTARQVKAGQGTDLPLRPAADADEPPERQGRGQ